jgi:hypothetical protein
MEQNLIKKIQEVRDTVQDAVVCKIKKEFTIKNAPHGLHAKNYLLKRLTISFIVKVVSPADEQSLSAKNRD